MKPPVAPVYVECSRAASVLATANELGKSGSLSEMLRGAVEFARAELNLERVGIHLQDDAADILRGTWGTGLAGETVDERSCGHRMEPSRRAELRGLQARGALWLFHEDILQCITTRDGGSVAKRTWLAVTPLIASGELLGVMYNDAVLTNREPNVDSQLHAALLCSLLANLVSSRRQHASHSFSPENPQSGTLKRALAVLEQEPLVSGGRLAQLLGVSPGYLCRAFKAQVGISLVEYRNRFRMQRFCELVDAGETNLLSAARGSGFGSYAQFHRVYRQLLDGSPRDYMKQYAVASATTSGDALRTACQAFERESTEAPVEA